jgi:uncharacterized membrane protein ArfB
MDFIIQWLWYLVAFVAGSAVALLITAVSIRRTTEEQAMAELPGSRPIGGR